MKKRKKGTKQKKDEITYSHKYPNYNSGGKTFEEIDAQMFPKSQY